MINFEYHHYPVITESEMRDLEVQISISDDIIIGTDINKIVSCPIPTSLQLIKQNEVVNPLTVCHHRGNTYVGLGSGEVVKIDADDNSTPLFACGSTVLAIRAKGNSLFLLQNSIPLTVGVYDLNGNLTTSWNHNDSTNRWFHGARLVLINDQVAVADRLKEQIVIYSESGIIIKQVPCPYISDAIWSVMCEAGQNHIILTNYNQSKVFKLNLTSGEVEWTCTDIPNPEGVVCYGRDYVIVYSYTGPEGIWILNQKTGKKVLRLMVFLCC